MNEQITKAAKRLFDDLVDIQDQLNLPYGVKIENPDTDEVCVSIADDQILATPKLRLVQSISPKPVRRVFWDVSVVTQIPGHFSPWDGGYPPDVDINDVVTDIPDHHAVIKAMIRLFVDDQIDSCLMEKQLAETEDYSPDST
jgi:hypothetical protein